MRTLIVTATDAEVAPLVARLGPDTRVLTTGVGMVATAAACAEALATARYDLAVNAGVCGSFRREHEPGAVVHVVADRFPELGAQDGDDFLTVHDLKLLGENEFPYRGGLLVNASPPDIPALAALPRVTGITVNTVHGNAAAIARVVERFDPDVESMEGAAFMYVCLRHQVPFAQIRAVSNMVERRNRASWKMTDAIDSLTNTMLAILD